MSPDVLLECPRTSSRDVLRVNVTERVWIFPREDGGGVDSHNVSKIRIKKWNFIQAKTNMGQRKKIKQTKVDETW